MIGPFKCGMLDYASYLVGVGTISDSLHDRYLTWSNIAPAPDDHRSHRSQRHTLALRLPDDAGFVTPRGEARPGVLEDGTPVADFITAMAPS
jgi:hypothetical protein